VQVKIENNDGSNPATAKRMARALCIGPLQDNLRVKTPKTMTL